jgi:hypothetical protein
MRKDLDDDLPSLFKVIVEERSEYSPEPRRVKGKTGYSPGEVRIRDIPFHIQHNTTPRTIVLALSLAREEKLCVKELAGRAGFSPGTSAHIIPFIRQMDLLDSRLRLTETGERFYRLASEYPDLLGEAVHVHLYTLHWFDPEVRFSWAYAQVTDLIRSMAGLVTLSGQFISRLAEYIRVKAGIELGIPAERIAFSQNSVRGVLIWLESLNPPVIQREGRRRKSDLRHVCPPETLLWAADALKQLGKLNLAELVPWDSETAEYLRSICLIRSWERLGERYPMLRIYPDGFIIDESLPLGTIR